MESAVQFTLQEVNGVSTPMLAERNRTLMEVIGQDRLVGFSISYNGTRICPHLTIAHHRITDGSVIVIERMMQPRLRTDLAARMDAIYANRQRADERYQEQINEGVRLTGLAYDGWEMATGLHRVGAVMGEWERASDEAARGWERTHPHPPPDLRRSDEISTEPLPFPFPTSPDPDDETAPDEQARGWEHHSQERRW
jgi:hypothetical protein